MTDKHTPDAVRYIGHVPKLNENHFAVQSGFTDLPPIPFARLIEQAPALLEALEALAYTFSDYEDGQTIKNERQLAVAIEAIMPQAGAAIEAATKRGRR